jgi:perosamine synthetase
VRGLPGVSWPRVTEGCDPSWWFFLFRVKAQEMGATADEVAAALKAEGVPVGAHYIGDPIYTYPIFRDHSAFAHGPHPFAAREYRRGLCPTAEAILETCVILPVNEGYDEQDLEETVGAFEKVVGHFRGGREGAR